VLDFSFLTDRAAFQIGESLLEVGPADSYLQVLAAGLVNTLTVVAVALPLASVLGLVLGLLRLSRHPLVYRAMALLVEPVRNTPVLLQLFVWYALLLNLPQVRAAWQPLTGVFLSNRGLALPLLQGMQPFLLAVLAWAAAGCARWAAASRSRFVRWPLAALLLAGLASCFATLPAPVVDRPSLAGFGLQGGWSLSPEFTALALGLTLFHAVYISDVVRGAVLAVPLGQVEAAMALGMRSPAVARTVVLPFALRSAVPPYANQCLMLLKNSTLAIAIGYQELMAIVNTVVTQTGRALEGMGLATACYLAASGVMALLLSQFNRRATRQGIDGAGPGRLGQRLGVPRLTAAALWRGPVRMATSAVVVALGAWALWAALRWALWSAVWSGSAEACEKAGGACWAAVTANWPLLLFGTMAADQRPAALQAVLLVLAGAWLALRTRLPGRWRAGLALACWLLAAVVLGGLEAGTSPLRPLMWGGVLVTVVMSVASIALALPLGLALMLMRRSPRRWLATPAVLLIEAVRAVPLVTQLLLVSFVVPVLFGGDWSGAKFQLALGALVLHTACLLAEVVRGAFQALPASQGISARALGMRPATVLWSVLLPQARRLAAPAALGVFVGAVKDTSLVAVIGVFDVLSAAKAVVADTTWRPFYVEIYLAVALFYFLACLWLSRVAERMRRQPEA
jgi:His/Glu/Gln/Arg/opine family amino acid ABC transporter permease subunit